MCYIFETKRSYTRTNIMQFFISIKSSHKSSYNSVGRYRLKKILINVKEKLIIIIKIRHIITQHLNKMVKQNILNSMIKFLYLSYYIWSTYSHFLTF